MLVINANNNQDTTNYMLADPQYPDVNQILMWGGPKWLYSASSNSTATVSFPVLDTIDSVAINHYCPKIYKYNLGLINSSKTKEGYGSVGDVQPDIGAVRIATSGSGSYNVTISGGHIIYTTAVSGLTAGHTVGEYIYAPLLFFSGQGATNNGVEGTGVSVTFKLLHNNGTSTSIATINLSRQGGTATNDICNSPFAGIYCTAQWLGVYNGQGQVAQDGDILSATVDITVSKMYTAIPGASCGLLHGGANPNMWDLYGFRPFQVSIRDS